MSRKSNYNPLNSAIIAFLATSLLSMLLSPLGLIASTATVHAAADAPAGDAAPQGDASRVDAAPVAAAAAAAPTLVRVTSSFEVKHAAAVLKQVAKLFHAGFVRKDAEGVARDIDALPADQSRQWEFAVTYKRVSYPLQIRARLDDFGMLDLDFFCAPAAAEAVRTKVDGYLNSRGL